MSNGKSDRLSIRITSGRKDLITKAAESMGLTISEYILFCEEKSRLQHDSSQQWLNMEMRQSLPLRYGRLSNQINHLQNKLCFFSQHESCRDLQQTREFIRSLARDIEQIKEEMDHGNF